MPQAITIIVADLREDASDFIKTPLSRRMKTAKIERENI